MLALIEINLLPAEFRRREKTNLPLILSIACGLTVVGGIALFGVSKNRDLAALESKLAQKSEDEKVLSAEAKEIDELKKDISQQRSRQDTIIAISESKIMWSLKLSQLARIMSEPKFADFWISNLRVTNRGKTGRGELSMSVSALGNDYNKVSEFREAIKNDPNFFYHFQSLESATITVRSTRAASGESVDQLSFQLRLPIGDPDAQSGGGKGKKKKKKGKKKK